ncbi:hypothetical protein K449DRAFT_395168 [Hypoxylon sp. EC38]|nr:hypothetical protein K449DRAFT_395168 [Hypoxylon sp. EC38]
MPSVSPKSETTPRGASIASHQGTMKNRYRGGRYRGRFLERLSSQHLDSNLGSGVTPPPSPQQQQPSWGPLRPHGRTWRARLHQHKLEQRFRDKPKGANLGLMYDYQKQKNVPYKKDRFSGAIRPRTMMDDLWDNMSEKRFHLQYRLWQTRKLQLEDKQMNDIDEEVNGLTTMPQPDWTSSDYEDYDSDLGFPEHKGTGSIRHLDPDLDKESPSSSVEDSDKVKVKEESHTSVQGSSPLSDLSSEISEEE